MAELFGTEVVEHFANGARVHAPATTRRSPTGSRAEASSEREAVPRVGCGPFRGTSVITIGVFPVTVA
ncbi:hypothetical protein OG948_12140 [Embleya sp. NBC_00888]|uniref:hypothetical protein n=1 Tax=Embleya sp. NBC_00888 TaxID=2975960 RepID=UPI00387001D1|nr:hypothetical protein OG948_12140 [Embleya sp. NBC_00888]